jgi:hypothetical protein
VACHRVPALFWGAHRACTIRNHVSSIFTNLKEAHRTRVIIRTAKSHWDDTRADSVLQRFAEKLNRPAMGTLALA